ncbi:YciI family protein [Reichenbachiella carrageenanivorans]|uniref:YciI family protein n=1 Tax=Reichenbachiella carrageenanivorans TaxID=2979869 RepID=A0ABY6D3J1_9BACT|nr:YciI family protein [Reichenbachiella carrageenanivorans]UXX80729.1 YciI family protein [Reichenbachiella carrageenanivorans]
MKKLAAFSFLVLIVHLGYSQTPREFPYQDGDTTYIMKQYFMGFLKRVENKPDLDSVKAAEIQQAHLDYMSANGKSGALLIAGPFGDDGDMRGVVIYDVATKAEADSIISNDPAVKAGRLAIEVHPWWAAKGSRLK